MTQLELQVKVIRQYIFNLKGVDIRDINLRTHDDIMKCNWAFNYIINHTS
jgi:hypothetical protein